MIRVVYRWRVAEEDFPRFREAWTHTTNRIHETVPGALGSFMLRGPEDKTEVLTVAKWDAMESWKAFWGAENPSQMVGMFTTKSKTTRDNLASISREGPEPCMIRFGGSGKMADYLLTLEIEEDGQQVSIHGDPEGLTFLRSMVGPRKRAAALICPEIPLPEAKARFDVEHSFQSRF